VRSQIGCTDRSPASHLTPYGKAAVRWEREGDRVVVEADVPANTEADVVLPDGQQHCVGSGSHRWTVDAPVGASAPGEVGLDSSLAAIIDDPDAYASVLRILGAERIALAEDFRDHTEWGERLTLEDRLSHLAGPQVRASIQQRLAELSARRRSSGE
jgi:alpha-L-rhamnosidase